MGICKSCGSKYCNGFCKMAIGEKTYRFINNVSKSCSYLGRTSESYGETIYCVADEMYLDGSVAKIYKTKKIDVNKQVFEGDFGINVSEAVDNYRAGLSDADRKDDITLEDINNRRYQIIPFRPNTKLEVRVNWDDGSKGRGKVEKTEVSAIRWGVRLGDDNKTPKRRRKVASDENNSESLNEESTEEVKKHKRGRKKAEVKVEEGTENTNVIEYQELVTRIEDGKTNKKYRVNIEEYGKTYNLADVILAKPRGFARHTILEMTPYGFFKPIAVKVADTTFVIDCDGLYVYKGDEVTDLRDIHLAGEWNGLYIKINKEISELKVDSYYKKYINDLCLYVGTCKDYIAPLGSTKCNLINL